ncbi:DNA cytosine methyltransferase [Kitasatospora sp. YST-16]|uniref:DNA cytosine methyltransferase n=1 Tax=Kitasatospora sp. YST-16 TaxID=2998080 RepID=UPI002284660D|nr:DNA cytosine methyltransferase [Kitasatospora sp. YST-16]WAL72644.1 DNA cytosine methyltransferase [Kitasatospora sp. YST-16]WNW38692.1 DNA cytosine methyltransferase [Streptomyces sp. Li-HN-5-13]
MQPTKIVDLFAGPGGLDVAAEKLGIPTVGVEWDSAACTTRRAAGLETVEGDVRLYGPADFPEADVLAGGPPCQTFTVAGTGAGRKALDEVLNFVERIVAREDREEIEKDLSKLDDERTGLVLRPLMWALDAIDKLDRPYKAIVLEQVPAVLPVWKAYRKALLDEGYEAECGILHTEAFGVPQTRRRAVLIARYGKDPVKLPTPTHRVYRKGVARDAGDTSLLPWRTMADAVGRTDAFEVISNYGTGGNPKARGRRGSGEPSATVTGKISRNRVVGLDGSELERFSPSEAGRLQTFPADYPWSGRDVGQQIGNAVPPRLAMHVLSAAFGWPSPTDALLQKLTSWASPSAQQPAPADRTAEENRQP